MEGYSPKLQRLRSCSCAVLDVGNWCNSHRRTGGGFSRRYSDDYYDEEEEFDPSYYPTGRSLGMRWRGIWRRIVKEKRRILNSAAPMHAPYDPYTYAQNFDEGSAWVEPENLTRSFSARFAVPSRMLQRVA